MKKLIEYGRDHHPAEDEDKLPSAWAVAIRDDCDACERPIIELTLEEVGRPGYGQVAHLSPDDARQVLGALTRALRELGEDR
jgi:hypothetical protein